MGLRWYADSALASSAKDKKRHAGREYLEWASTYAKEAAPDEPPNVIFVVLWGVSDTVRDEPAKALSST